MPSWRKLFNPPKSENLFWKGALNGLHLFLLFLTFITGLYFNTGLPPLLMGFLFLLIGFLFLLLLRVISTLVYYLLSRIAASVVVAFLASLAMAYVIRMGGFSWPGSIFYQTVVIAFMAQILVFGSAYYLLRSRKSSVLMILMLIVGLAIDGYGIYWVLSSGTNELTPEFNQKSIEQISAPNPSEPGDFQYSYFTYGSGKDERRAEYGDEVTYETQSVDASLILPEWTGKKAERRQWFWGFGVKEFPINGRVWLPDGEGPFPIVLIVHGNHGMEDFSDGGYGYIGELLASRGSIAVSVDENFINGTWSGDFQGKEMPTRGWLLLKHLEIWRAWSEDESHPLYKKMDPDNIILVGHSRGGEAVAIAAAFNKLKYFPDDSRLEFDFNFNIKGLISIAPTDKRYFRRMELENINYLTLQGSYDSDEASFFGWRQAGRVHFSDSNFWFKSGLYIHGANHGQFNTTWGSRDFGPPGGWMLDINTLITPEDQQQAAKLYISAFVEVVCKSNSDLLPMFKTTQVVSEWLPQTIYLNTYHDSEITILEDFEDDLDITTSGSGSIQAENMAVWREDVLRFRDNDFQGNKAVVLGWNEDSLKREAYYHLELEEPVSINSNSKLSLMVSLGNPDDLKLKEEEKDSGEQLKNLTSFSVVLHDTLGNSIRIPINYHKEITPRLEINYMKLETLSKNLGKKWEPTPEYFEFKLQDFDGDVNSFLGLKSIKLVFDQSTKGIVIVDDIAIYGSEN